MTLQRREKSDRINAEWMKNKPSVWGKGKYDKERSMCYQLLADDEHIYSLIGGALDAPLGSLSVRTGVVVATSHRLLILVGGGLFTSQVGLAMDYAKLTNVTFKKDRLWSTITLTGESAYELLKIGQVAEREAGQIFADFVNRYRIHFHRDSQHYEPINHNPSTAIVKIV